MRVVPLAFLAVVACASDHTASKVVGEVGDVHLSAKSAIGGTANFYAFGKTKLQGTHTVVAITDFHNVCDDTEVSGHMLYLDLFSHPSQPDSEIHEPGEYAVWPPSAVSMGLTPDTPSVVASFTRHGTDGSGRIFMALEGQVDITSVDESGIKGTFDLTFDAGHVTGVIDTDLCDKWVRSSILP